MKVLSLDSSFSSLNLTLIEDGKVLVHHSSDTNRKTLELLPLTLKRLDINPEEVDAYAVSLGVGYQTSLRIGITFVKTLAYLSKKPLVGYENLQLMCSFLRCPEEKAVALRVSNNIFYRLCKVDSVSPIQVLKEAPKIPIVGLAMQGLGDIQLEYFPFSLYGGLWAYRRLTEGYTGDNPLALEPLYLKPPV